MTPPPPPDERSAALAPAREASPGAASSPRHPLVPDDRRAKPLLAAGLWASTLAVLALTLIFGLVGVELQAWWDSDPMGQPERSIYLGFTPTMLAAINLLSIAVAGVALAVHALAGGRIRWLASALALGGIVSCLLVGLRDAETLTRGSSWASGVALALAACHLAQHARLRRFMAAGILGLAIPLATSAVHFVLVERPLTERMFERNRAATLEAQGWAPDSPQAQAFVRRLTSPDAVGVFNLSNVLGSISAMIAAVALGSVFLALARRGRDDGKAWRAVACPSLIAVLALTCLALTHSKGAAVALAMALPLIVAGPLLARRGGRWGLALVAVALPAAAVAAILVRGALGPAADDRGERSLLFRFHYLQAAAGMVAADPVGTLIAGRGAGGFVESYFTAKNPINPEDVTSTHNLVADYALMLGLGGLAWSALALLWLTQAALHARATLDPVPSPLAPLADTAAAPLGLAAVLGFALFITQYAMHLPGMTPERGVIWIFNTLGFILLTGFLAHGGDEADRRLRLGLLAGAAVLLTHNQIEMTFFQAGSATLGWLMLAVAAGGVTTSGVAAAGPATLRWPGEPAGPTVAAGAPAEGRPGLRSRTIDLLPAAALLALLVPSALLQAAPTIRHEQQLFLAAEARRTGHAPAALDALERAAKTIPADLLAYRWFSLVSLEMARSLERSRQRADALGVLDRSVRLLHVARARAAMTGSVNRFIAQTQVEIARISNNRSAAHEAIARWRDVIARRPYSLPDHVALGDLLWELGQRDAAATLYRRALVLSAQAYLDPVRTMLDRDRSRIEARLAQQGSGAEG